MVGQSLSVSVVCDGQDKLHRKEEPGQGGLPEEPGLEGAILDVVLHVGREGFRSPSESLATSPCNSCRSEAVVLPLTAVPRRL